MNESLLDWLLEDYILGPTGLGNENISGFFLDDYWCYEDAGDGIDFMQSLSPWLRMELKEHLNGILYSSIIAVL